MYVFNPSLVTSVGTLYGLPNLQNQNKSKNLITKWWKVLCIPCV